MRHCIQIPLLFSTLLCLAIATGCGKDKEDKKDRAELSRPPSSGDLTRALDCNGGGGAPPEEEAAALTDYRLRQVPAEDLALNWKGELKTLCDVMKGTGKPLVFTSFVSSSCYTCMVWAEEVSLDLEGSGIGHIVVVTDKSEEMDDEDMAALQAEIAPAATWVRDEYGELWTFFGEGDRTKPLLVVMDDFAQGFYVDGDETTEEVVAQANARMGFDFQVAKPE